MAGFGLEVLDNLLSFGVKTVDFRVVRVATTSFVPPTIEVHGLPRKTGHDVAPVAGGDGFLTGGLSGTAFHPGTLFREPCALEKSLTGRLKLSPVCFPKNTKSFTQTGLRMVRKGVIEGDGDGEMVGLEADVGGPGNGSDEMSGE